MKKATSHLANDQTIARTLQAWKPAKSARTVIHSPVNLAAETAELQARAWNAIKRARDALRLPVPDTLLGRRHYDFIPPPVEHKD
ncbi:hypothetical protein [Bradyrhizobium liaoningense]|uniref:hypothetical protein n=1 Tax=Bradyrhizobium liaoningense TaxID=43992 RepID=UPI001BACBA1C|nr:hypothetical protein [Bradyrhizobium liaoningense]MBR0719226.1 hypothetical protein [Bradyrhizobium liaoningense]